MTVLHFIYIITLFKGDQMITVFSFRYLSSQIGVLFCAAAIFTPGRLYTQCVWSQHQQTCNAFPPHSAVTDPQSLISHFIQ